MAGYAFPVRGYKGKAQLHHGSEPGAADLFAPPGTPVVSMTDGVVADVGTGGPGGNNLTIRGADGRSYYYAHLIAPPSVKPGQRVSAGMRLGGVGQTGNAEKTEAHLHIGIGASIQSGTGPKGGAGTNFDAVSFLNRVNSGQPAGATPGSGGLVDAAATRHGVPVGLARAVVGQESGGRNDATSPVGAAGVMQLMPDTARGLGLKVGDGVDERRDPAKNIDAGMRYLRQQYDTFKSWPLALAAYNAGPGAVEKYGGVPPFKETQTYVRNITARAGSLEPPAEGGKPVATPTTKTTTKTVSKVGGNAAPPTTDVREILRRLEATKGKASVHVLDPEITVQEKDKYDQLQNVKKPNPTPVRRHVFGDGTYIDERPHANDDGYDLMGGTALKDAGGADGGDETTTTTTEESGGAADKAPNLSFQKGADGRVYGINPQTGESMDMGFGSDADAPMTPNESDVSARGWAGLELEKQKTAVAMLGQQIAAGRLDYDQAKDFLDRLDKMPPVVNVGGKWYTAGFEPGGMGEDFAKRLGVPFKHQEANVIDVAGALGRPDLNKSVLAGPYAQSLNQYGVKTGQGAPGVASDKAAGAPEGAGTPGTESAPLSPETSAAMRDVPSGGNADEAPVPKPMPASQRPMAAAQQAEPPSRGEAAATTGAMGQAPSMGAEPPSRMSAAATTGAMGQMPTQPQVQANEQPPASLGLAQQMAGPTFGAPPPAPMPTGGTSATTPPGFPIVPGQGGFPAPAPAPSSMMGSSPLPQPGMPAPQAAPQPGGPTFGDPRVERDGQDMERAVQAGIQAGYSEQEAREMARAYLKLNGG